MSEDLINTLVEALRQLQLPQHSNGNASQNDGHGFQLQPYNENEEAFDNYILRLENFYKMRNITGSDNETNTRKVQILLNCLSPGVFQTLTALTAPLKPYEIDYDRLITLLKEHLCPKASEMAEQHRFVLRLQEEGESIGQYIAHLRQIANTCNFVCTTCNASTMDVHLRSQLVRGVYDNDIRERILQQGAAMSFEETVKIALATETAKLESQQMRNQRESMSNVNKISLTNKVTNMTFKDKLKNLQGCCFRCGSSSHRSNACEAKNKTCNNCRKIGIMT